jgi:uncharacterized protein YndB with AHSA1/START domain
VTTLAAAPADVVKEIDVRASPSDVWKAWTTVDGVKTFFAPAARIDLRPGGAYEIAFDGTAGSTVVAIEPMKKLAFGWSIAPHAPTTVTVELLPQGKTTRVRLTQSGSTDEHFERTWGVVLARLAHRFRRGPLDWNHPWSPVSVEALRFLEGNHVSADGLELENWVFSPAGLLGSSREIENGKPVFYELASIEPEDGEWVLTFRMFKVGLSSHPKTEKEAVRLVLDAVEPGRAVFVSEFGEPVRIEYARHADELTVEVKTATHEEKHTFVRPK